MLNSDSETEVSLQFLQKYTVLTRVKNVISTWQENVIAKRVLFSASRHRRVLQIFLHLLFPTIQRGGAYAVLIGGWSLAAYLIQWTWGNLKDLIVNHSQWVIGYLVVVGKAATLDKFFPLQFCISMLPFPGIYMQPQDDQSILLVVLVWEKCKW